MIRIGKPIRHKSVKNAYNYLAKTSTCCCMQSLGFTFGGAYGKTDGNETLIGGGRVSCSAKYSLLFGPLTDKRDLTTCGYFEKSF